MHRIETIVPHAMENIPSVSTECKGWRSLCSKPAEERIYRRNCNLQEEATTKARAARKKGKRKASLKGNRKRLQSKLRRLKSRRNAKKARIVGGRRQKQPRSHCLPRKRNRDIVINKILEVHVNSGIDNTFQFYDAHTFHGAKSILFQRHAALLVTSNALCLMSGLMSGI